MFLVCKTLPFRQHIFYERLCPICYNDKCECCQDINNLVKDLYIIYKLIINLPLITDLHLFIYKLFILNYKIEPYLQT